MTAREYLDQIRILDARITNLLDNKNALWDGRLPSGISYGVHVQQSKNVDQYTDWLAKLTDLEQQINQEIDRLVDLKMDITEQINDLKDARYIQVLHLRHVDLMRYRDIASEMGYSIEHVRRLHGQALQAFERRFCKKNE